MPASKSSLAEVYHADGPQWLPKGKTAAVVFSVDDIHPGTSRDAYEAGGDLENGALRWLADLLNRHPYLHATLCVTPDWRLDSLIPDRPVLRHVPLVNRYVHWTRLHPAGRFRIDRHPELTAYLNGLERCESVLHGLTHSHPGPRFAVEFQRQTVAECASMIQQGLDIFKAAQLKFVRGYVPPAWEAPPPLLEALGRLGFEFICSARDLETDVTREAVTAMSGLKGVSLIYPEFVGTHRLVHFSCNFQATSSFERAVQIVDLGGVLHVKAHIFKSGGGHVMLDGLDEVYCNKLDMLFSMLRKRCGSRLWWARLSEVAGRMRDAA